MVAKMFLLLLFVILVQYSNAVYLKCKLEAVEDLVATSESMRIASEISHSERQARLSSLLERHELVEFFREDPKKPIAQHPIEPEPPVVSHTKYIEGRVDPKKPTYIVLKELPNCFTALSKRTFEKMSYGERNRYFERINSSANKCLQESSFDVVKTRVRVAGGPEENEIIYHKTNAISGQSGFSSRPIIDHFRVFAYPDGESRIQLRYSYPNSEETGVFTFDFDYISGQFKELTVQTTGANELDHYSCRVYPEKWKALKNKFRNFFHFIKSKISKK